MKEAPVIANMDRLRDLLARVGEVREPFPSAVNPDLPHIIQAKEAERRRLRALPWLEKLEMLDRLRERRLSLWWMQLRRAGTRLGSG